MPLQHWLAGCWVVQAGRMPPKKQKQPPHYLGDDAASSASHGNLIAAASRWTNRLEVECKGKRGWVLGG